MYYTRELYTKSFPSGESFNLDIPFAKYVLVVLIKFEKYNFSIEKNTRSSSYKLNRIRMSKRY